MITVIDPGPPGHATFFVSLLPTRADWPADMTASEQAALSGHAQHLSDNADSGRCVIAGPCLDAQLGIAVWDGLQLDELVAELRANDPMVMSGFFDATVRAMRLSFER
ncbi:MAG: hypothetical protein ABR549_13670 [Mycobacteriales bacterium]